CASASNTNSEGYYGLDSW
nr:immunoglobulin heavy chain junction region [Macaca mulatta]MOV39366.1 immunoglobulin heavy chain junction region [Macaca mulatta]MOV39654.1 immunoglobulin heavy chain junction region [Macaca mulatta]MOV39860.1 immunoglobulin heavy chain junction region [Macaca mulatta]MOV40105.1 immunoglobulin heavy chain junction region [Macaca mulatta]